MRIANVTARWDPKGEIWVVKSSDIEGLVLGARTKAELENKIQLVAVDLLELNTGSVDYDKILIEYVEHTTIDMPRAA